jgi:hypothetical protein
LGRSYGHRFLESLPPMARTRSMDDVRAFFETPNEGGQGRGVGQVHESAVWAQAE